MKLTDILEDSEYRTKESEYDKDTGTITWSVSYDKVLFKRLDELENIMARLAKQYKKDKKIKKYYDTLKTFKRSLKTYITQNYED